MAGAFFGGDICIYCITARLNLCIARYASSFEGSRWAGVAGVAVSKGFLGV